MNRHNSVFLYIILVIMLLTGCNDLEKNQLDLALQTAKGNRQELEKVLRYYQRDKQKEDAAKFLIRNMLGKSYLEGKTIDEFHLFIDSVYQTEQEEYDQQTINKSYQTKSKDLQGFTRQQTDLQQLKAEFLIAQIDGAFRVWQKP